MNENTDKVNGKSGRTKTSPSKRALLNAKADNATVFVAGPGWVLAKRYELIEEIGRGGMGVVFKAYDRSLERDVAVKILPPEMVSSAKAISNFKREAKVALGLHHPQIVSLYQFLVSDGIAFLVMELLEGQTLEERLVEANGPLPLAEAIEIITQVGDAVSYAHKCRVVHRDIKPANIFLKAGETVNAQLMDFGIADHIRTTVSRVTGHMAAGTLLYMSPEQLRGKRCDERSDVYSLTATFYECLAEQPPFTFGDISYQIVNEQPTSIEDVPDYVNATLMRGLAKKADNRFQTVTEFIEALEKKSCSIEKPLPASTPATEVVAPKKRTILPLVGGFVFLLFLSLGALALWLPKTPKEPVVAPPSPTLVSTPQPSKAPLPTAVTAAPTPEPPIVTKAPTPEPTPEPPPATRAPTPEPTPEPPPVTTAPTPEPPPVTVVPTPEPTPASPKPKTLAKGAQQLELLIGKKQDSAALSLLRSLIRDYTDHQGELLQAVNLFLNQGRYASALKALRLFNKRFQSVARWTYIGNRALEGRNHAIAIKAFTSARLAGKGAHEAAYNLAVICRKSGKTDKALKYIKEALAIAPGTEAYEMELARLQQFNTSTKAEYTTRVTRRTPQRVQHRTDPLLREITFIVTCDKYTKVGVVTLSFKPLAPGLPYVDNVTATEKGNSSGTQRYYNAVVRLPKGVYEVNANIEAQAYIPMFKRYRELPPRQWTWKRCTVGNDSIVVLQPDAYCAPD